MYRCMEPVSIPQVVQEAGFIHQIKWDGIRGIAVIGGGHVTLYNKSGRECTGAYPELGALPRQMDTGRAVTDGEIVAFVDGRPSFYHALKRSRTHGSRVIAQYPVRYIVFDLLSLDGKDLREKPLEERQALLRTHFCGNAVAALADDFDDGDALLSLMKQKGMEGVVSKRRGSAYTPGKNHSDWFKTKVAHKLLCAVTGIRMRDGRPASLELAVYRDGALAPVGHAGSGLAQHELKQLGDYARREGKHAGDVIRVEPRLTCWVRFAEWTAGGTLRHPVLLGFSDQPVRAATGEEIGI